MEQGIGDQLFFLGLLKAFKKKTNASFIIQTDPRLVDLLSKTFPDHEVTSEIDFENYDFDHVHICLSPQYIYPDHWHYFSMFISAYEEFSGKDAIIYTEKYETHVRHQRLHNEILHQCSDGRRPLPSKGLREWKALRK